MNFKKIAALVLAVALGLTPVMLTGCDGDSDGPGRGDAGEITDLPDSFGEELRDFDGMKFNVLTKKNRGKGQAFNITDLVSEGELGDEAINEAVETRNANLYDVFGFIVERSQKGTQFGAKDAANEAMLKQDKTYKAFILGVAEGLSIACEGKLVNLTYSNYVDFSREYWDDAVINNLLLNGGAYIALGDINTTDEDCTMCVLFNKELWTELSGNDPKELYDLVKSGGWTLQAMKNYSMQYHRKGGTSSTTDKWDPTYTGDGTYGCAVENGDPTVLLQASGNTVSKQDDYSAYGFINNMQGNAEFYQAAQVMFDFFGGTDKYEWQLNYERDVGNITGEDRWETVMRRAMKDDKVLFYMNHVGSIALLRDMDSDFGVLPLPKVTADQEMYGNTIQYSNATCYAIPAYTDEENEAAEYILEAMCYYSSESYFEAIGSDGSRSLKYAYRETVLKRKATRDDESMEMLDLVFNNRIFDIAIALDINEITKALPNACVIDGDIDGLVRSMPNFDNLIAEKLAGLL